MVNPITSYFSLMIFHARLWSIFSKGKDEAFGAFQKFKALVENESGYAIKALRTNRGGEFTFMEFNKFCEAHEICQFLTIPYKPQQNGVME